MFVILISLLIMTWLSWLWWVCAACQARNGKHLLMHIAWRHPSLVAPYTWKLAEESRLKRIAEHSERSHWSPQEKDLPPTSALPYCSCCLLSAFTGTDEDYFIYKFAKKMCRRVSGEEVVVIWLLYWKALQPDLNMMLSLSRAKNRRTKAEGHSGQSLWWVTLVRACVCVVALFHPCNRHSKIISLPD